MIDDKTPGINVYHAGPLGPAVVLGRQGSGEVSTTPAPPRPSLPPLVLNIPAASEAREGRRAS